jgi:hypothetical protein
MGYRYNKMERSIWLCSDCESEDLERLGSSFYLRPYIEYRFNRRFQAQLYFAHHLQDKGFGSSLGLRFSLFGW